jgi:hypothetical protein
MVLSSFSTTISEVRRNSYHADSEHGGAPPGPMGPRGLIAKYGAPRPITFRRFPRAVVSARGNVRAAPQRGLAKSWVQYGTPRPLYATATPTLRNRQLRMFARCPGLDIQSPMTSRGLRWPQAMFSP